MNWLEIDGWVVAQRRKRRARSALLGVAAGLAIGAVGVVVVDTLPPTDDGVGDEIEQANRRWLEVLRELR